MIELAWPEFRDQVLDIVGWNWKYFESNNEYKIFAKQNGFIVECRINKDSGADQAEFESDYKPNASAEFIDRTQTQFERDDIVLKLAKASGQANASGDLTIDLVVPGNAGEVTRYAAGGYLYTDNYSWDDSIDRVEIVDVNNIFGYGANTVLKTYHDHEVDEENRGWFFEKSHGSEGVVEIEPMGWYGALRGGLVLRLVIKIQANAKAKALIWWGTVE